MAGYRNARKRWWNRLLARNFRGGRQPKGLKRKSRGSVTRRGTSFFAWDEVIVKTRSERWELLITFLPPRLHPFSCSKCVSRLLFPSSFPVYSFFFFSFFPFFFFFLYAYCKCSRMRCTLAASWKSSKLTGSSLSREKEISGVTRST